MEKIKKNKQKHFVVLSVITLLYLIVYLIWRATCTIPDLDTYGYVAFICGIALLCAEGLSVFEALIHYVELNRSFIPVKPEIPDEMYPEVDVFIATHNEEVDLLFKTVNACTQMDYPDKSKVHVYLCDDGCRPAVAAMAKKMKVGYLDVPGNKLAKAGNLNNALSKTASPLICTFDADMIPNSDFLMETVPFFFLPVMKQKEDGSWVKKKESEMDPEYKIGFIQTPQSFYNPDLFQYNLYSEERIPNEQDYFFRQINVAKNSSNSVIYAGSNTVISREALELVGGIATGTITEDFETGLRIQMEGYTCYAIDKLLAKGLSPITVPSLIKQRERWARGCIYSLRRMHLFTNRKISWGLKIGYLACRIYWESFTRRLIYVFAPIFFMILGIPVVVCDFKDILCFWLPSYILYAITLKKISGEIRNTRWSNIIDTIMFPYMLLPVWAELLFIRKKEFSVTAKSRSVQQDNTLWLALPHMVLLALSVLSMAIAIKDLVLYQTFGTLIVLYWLMVNSFSLVMSIFFMQGRKNNRMSERFAVNVPLEVTFDGVVHEGTAIDISEGGFAFTMENAIYLPFDQDEEAEFTLRYGKYEAKVPGRIVTVMPVPKSRKWKYCVQIGEPAEEMERQYLQIIYDREHTLPKIMNKNSSYFGDMALNMMKRNEPVNPSRRRLARVVVNEEVRTEKGLAVRLDDFNFEFVHLSSTNGVALPEEMQLFTGTPYAMDCKRSEINPHVYLILNWRDLVSNPILEEQIEKWQDKDKSKRRRKRA